MKAGTTVWAFYGETLGLKMGSHSPDGVWTEYDLPGGGGLALFGSPQGGQPSAEAGGSVALEVEDLDALIAQLKGKGVQFKSELIHSPVCRMSVILDSEGNAISVESRARRSSGSARRPD